MLGSKKNYEDPWRSSHDTARSLRVVQGRKQKHATDPIDADNQNETKPIMELIGAKEPYKTLESHDLEDLAKTFGYKDFARDAVLIEQGQIVPHIGMIISGVVECGFYNRQGRFIPMITMYPGEYYGMSSFKPDMISLVTAIARTPVRTLSQNRQDFIRTMDKHPGICIFHTQLTLQRTLIGARMMWDDLDFTEPSHAQDPGLPKSITTALDYIEQRFAQSLRLEEVARESGVSRYHFSHLFNVHMGCTFKEYINRKRIAQAQILLDSQNINVSEAALQVGFSDFSYFSRVFKRIVGMRPSEYRKHGRNGVREP